MNTYLFSYFPILLLFQIVKCNSDTVDYYIKLINDNIARSEKYKLPKRNDEFELKNKSTGTHDFGRYDFIIVGAGSAGSVLATRLSEIQNWEILLIEAGDEENDFSKIPTMFNYLQFSKMNWGYFTTPQKNSCLGMKNKQCILPRGKVIGGSSSINAQIYIRGHPEDFNNWVKLGNPGWSYNETLPYFKKSENSQIDGDPTFHGHGGLWNIQYARPSFNISENFIEANTILNQKVLDYNGPQQIGVSKVQISIKKGQRQSMGTAFLDYARERKNLHVVTNALVINILIHKRSKTAQGVVFIKNGQKFRAEAKLEVILSGGVVNSPQLLMLSGIGPRKHLTEMDIEVVENLPVGRNLWDHPLYPGLIFHTNQTNSDNDDMRSQVKQYVGGEGVLTIPSNVNGLGFLNTGNLPKNVPMVEYLLIPFTTPIKNLGETFNYDNDLVENFLNRINFTSDVHFFLLLLHPTSRGEITLKTNNPLDFPNIDLNLFNTTEDIENLITGINFVLELIKTEPFQKINASLIDIPICKTHEIYSKPFWECTIRNMAMTLHHPAGTCRMGTDRRTSVVNHELKVHGVENLRVVDASVFPSTISGHLNAATVMVAEKISDAIKTFYNVPVDGNCEQ